MKWVMKLSFAAALAVAAGCAEHTEPDVEFPQAGTIRSHERMADIQRANGARGDGNLHAAHFTDDALNSLGRAKLDAMLRDDESVRPVTIHLAPAGEQNVQMRRIESVTAYLKDSGLTEAQMRFETGLNDASYHPSAPGLANLRKTDTAANGAEAESTPINTGGTGAGLTTMK
jgi:hypothetical protein